MVCNKIALYCMRIVLAFTALSFFPATPIHSAPAIKAPVISLAGVEVAHYWGYWFVDKKTEPTKGKLPANVGAPLDLAFVLNIKNPNPYPVQLEELKFTVAFEDFELNTVNAYETMWIPGDKTNQVRVHAMFDVATSFLSLGATGGFQLQKKQVSAWDQLEKWWTGIQTFSFPVRVTNGTARFTSGVKGVISSFEGVYPPKASK
ncbi:MAG: hypothetical protein GX443_09865 [Deltaproteobacteria bacterium]|nr:hypothetical protein [Deltaproteobacteria bacterium]